MVTEPSAPSKAELLETLRSSEREAIERLAALPASEFEQGRYENGWNVRQILAHVASIEWTYPRLIDLARQGAPQAPAERPAGGSPAASAPARGGIDSYNERQVEKRAGASVAELIEEFRKNRAATIAAVDEADEALLTTPIRSAGGITGTLAGVLQAVAVLHVLGHMNDIVGGEQGG